MRQLREQGYTFEAIREALAGAGVHVSNSTVQRELARSAKHQATTAPAAHVGANERSMAPSLPAVALAPAAMTCGSFSDADLRSGKEIAEAFMSSRITNRLIRPKEQR
jgi:hypothetical protein